MEEEIILMDTNVLTPGSLMPLLYESRKYSHLPIEPIIETNNSIDCFAGMMYRGDLVIVKGVVDELLDLHKNIIDKVKFLDSKGSGASDEARHNLQLLNSKLNKFIKKARKSQYKPSSKKDYESLVNLVIKLDDRLAIKKRAGYSDNQAVRTTDEKLTASAFYISIFEKKRQQC